MFVELDVYFKKEVELEFEGNSLRFRVAQDLFSSFDIDVGTRQLLRSLAQVDRADFGKVLDLGCGYGPIGIALRRAGMADQIEMVDRDALAVEYTRQNAALNQVSEMYAFGGLGYDDVLDDDYGLIVSNIPAKAGKPVIEHMLREAHHYLKPGGLVAVVVIAPIAGFVAGVLGGTDEIKVVFTRALKGYTVFHYIFNTEDDGPDHLHIDSVPEGVYRRGEATFQTGDLQYRLETTHGLQEFDSPSFQTRLLIDALSDMGETTVAVAAAVLPERIELVDRDLLALRYSMRNMALNGFPESDVSLVHEPGLALSGEADLIAGVIGAGNQVGHRRLNDGPSVTVFSPRRPCDRCLSLNNGSEVGEGCWPRRGAEGRKPETKKGKQGADFETRLKAVTRRPVSAVTTSGKSVDTPTTHEYNLHLARRDRVRPFLDGFSRNDSFIR